MTDPLPEAPHSQQQEQQTSHHLALKNHPGKLMKETLVQEQDHLPLLAAEDTAQEEQQLLKETLETMDPVLRSSVRSLKDRQFLLKVESQILACLSYPLPDPALDQGGPFLPPKQSHLHSTVSPYQIDFYNMNSYLRLLIHKAGQFYQMGSQAHSQLRCIRLIRRPETTV
jgi:hypothetical protein